jgi:hypothetical protein
MHPSLDGRIPNAKPFGRGPDREHAHRVL